MLIPPTNVLSHAQLNSSDQRNHLDKDRFLFQVKIIWRPTTSCTTNNATLLHIFQSIVNKWKRMGEKRNVSDLLCIQFCELKVMAQRQMPFGHVVSPQSWEKRLHPPSMDYMQYYILFQMEFHSISSSFFVGLYQLAFLLSSTFLNWLCPENWPNLVFLLFENIMYKENNFGIE